VGNHEEPGNDLDRLRQKLDDPLQAEKYERSSDPQGQTNEPRLCFMPLPARRGGFRLSFARALGEYLLVQGPWCTAPTHLVGYRLAS
jgi:hypothetical protein